MSSGSKNGRLEPTTGGPAPDDATNWLVIFSDMVLQLFAFVVVAAVLARADSEGTPTPREILRQAADSLVGIAAPIPGVPMARASSLKARPAVSTISAPVETAAPARASSLARPDDKPALAEPPASDHSAEGQVTTGPGTAALAVARATAVSRIVPAGLEEAPEKPRLERPRSEADRHVPRAAPRDSELRTEPRAEPPPARSPDQSWRSISRYLEALLEPGRARGAVQVEASSSGVVLRVGEAAGFATGAAELRGAKHAFIGAVATLAADLPELVIEIAGHTDDRPLHGGRFDSNLDLSFARARHVADRLLRAEPGLAGRILVAGWGADRPLVPNEDAAARALNRRVEIRLRTAA